MALQPCTKHWNAMKKALEDNGLFHLVPTNGQRAAEIQAKNMMGQEDKDNYDPLMHMNILFSKQAIKAAGPQMGFEYMGSPNFFCPLCEAEKHSGEPDMGQEWISGCVKELVDYCLMNHYIGPDYTKVNHN